ncbi:MAG: hypothetical protein JNJ59_25405 [Deltaproteobacteria bacterium]|nr:hypothetical protein [Deltaproteobacteria bacterium]
MKALDCISKGIVQKTLALGTLGVLGLGVPACGKDADTKSDTDRFAITVTPLSLEGVNDAWYTLRVWNGETPAKLVWEKEHIRSTEFGDSKGAITYVGTCDASAAPANQNRVELVVEKLVGPQGDLPAATWQNPAPAGRPLTLTRDCVANADTRVDFNITIMRDAQQGFFDIAVTFEDVFCSAKFDCVNEQGGPLNLLHRPGEGGERDRTVVMAFACTSGEGETTWLHMSDVLVECGVAPNVTSYWVNPAMVPDGNAGSVDPIFYQTAIYRDVEDFPGLDKCYWNMAFGVNQGPSAANCRIVASGTASSTPFGATQTTPANTIYPYVSYDIAVTDGAGQVMCGKNPLNGTGSSVKTKYTGFEGSRFPHSWQCGETPVTERVDCAGAIDGIGATFTQTPQGIAVAFGNSTTPTSGLYKLPEGMGLTLSNTCCMNPCCTDDGTPTP